MSEEAKCCCNLSPHPDHIVTMSMYIDMADSTTNSKRFVVLPSTLHLLHAEATLLDSAGTDAAYIKMFDTDDFTSEAEDETVWTFALGKTVGSAAWTPETLKGHLFNRGVYIDARCDDPSSIFVFNLVAVLRQNYTPAFPDTADWLLNSWQCWRGDDDLYENFNAGGNYSTGNQDGSDGTPDGALGEELGDF